MAACPSCGWPEGSEGCRAAHNPDSSRRMWTEPEWQKYRATGDKPGWDTRKE